MNFNINAAVYDLEDFDDEIVLVNIQTGIYFTMSESAPFIIRELSKGVNLSNVFDNINASSHDVNNKIAIKDFIELLIQEKILVDNSAINADNSIDFDQISSLPLYKKFEDIGDLIKLDPIHDVSDLGWPNKSE